MSTHPIDALGAPSIRSMRWRIDPMRSDVTFHTKIFWGIAAVKGSFSRYHGTLDLGAQPAIELTLEGDSLDTKNPKRDAHLRSPDFFGVEAHPYVRFVSETVVLDGERLIVRGRLHAHGASIPLTLEAALRPIGDELEVEAVTEADHRRLGMTWNKLGVVRTPSKLIVKGRLVCDDETER
jgi:polyisoprenoid-binding protein YceI